MRFTHGMFLNKTITIEGNGYTINGINKTRIFQLSASDVNLRDIIFINGIAISKVSSYYTGGAILTIGTCNNLNITNCTFKDCYSVNYAAAIDHTGTAYIDQCKFINNTNPYTGAYGEAHALSVSGYGVVTNSIFDGNVATRGSAIWVDKGVVNYNVFVNNLGNTILWNSNNNDYEYNWYGTNNPNFGNLFYGTQPKTWVVMNFTNLQAITSAGGNVDLLTTLDTIYNSSSGQYSKLNHTLPARIVNYTTTGGTLTPSTDTIILNHTTVLNYSSTLTSLTLSSTIDNQTLYIKTTDIGINITVTDDNPQLIEVITYTIKVTNYGPEDARDIVINFKPPINFEYVSDTGSGKYNITTGEWYIGNLTSYDVKTLNISVRVPYNYSLVNKTYNSTVNITGTYADFNNINDNDSVNITVRNLTGGSYTLLQYLIDKTPEGGTLNLDFNVTYDPVIDAWLQDGMRLNKTIIFNGCNYSINGINQARIFEITNGNVTINNLTLINGWWGTSSKDGGGAIRIYGNTGNVTINYCDFINNTANRWGGAIFGSSFYNINISNSNFYNNSAIGSSSCGGAIILHSGASDNTWFAHNILIYNCIFTNNTGDDTIIYTGRCDSVNITHSTIFENSASQAIYLGGQTGYLTLNNNVLVNLNPSYPRMIQFDTRWSVTRDYNNNWWGTNDPNWSSLINIAQPETWAIMNFTNITPILYSTGTSTLEVNLTNAFNSTSNNYTQLTGGLPTRTVTFEWTTGNVTPNTTNITNSVTSTFNYPANMGYWTVNATIDKQTLWIGSADIGIYITPSSNPIDDGENITFTVTVVNNGPMNASNVNVTLFLPVLGLNITNITNNTGFWDNNTNEWYIGNLTVGQNVTLIINGTLCDPGPYLIWNATIKNVTDYYDHNFTNNTFISNVTINQIADLEITKNISTPNPAAKDNVTYIIVIFNHGPSTAINITVFDNLSSKLIYLNSTATKGYYNETDGIWYVDNLTPNNNETLNITVLVNKSGFTNNFANVTSNITDRNLSNNIANISFETPPLSDLWVTINMEPQTSNYITYHIQAGNNGIEDANGTVVVFNLSNLYVYFNHTTDKGIYNNLTGVWDIGELNVNETVNMTLIVRLDFPTGTTFANVTTSVNITSWSTDLYPENNTDNVTFEAEIFGNFRLLQDIVDGWAENTTLILPRSFAYDPVMDAKLPGETYDLIDGVRLYKNITIINPNGYTLGGFDMARIFNISADNVILDGLKFYDGNSPLGAALNIHADNVQVLRSNFTHNTLFGDYGGEYSHQVRIHL